ncbi:probable AMP deaminase isoform X2 [Nymphaea colorata]|uniref:probable AMP deaminase isoform X2 n=1 Tax=Nymphaea colorata TaxID=210225 RepID=UPI00214F1367|nr:probable AMP deaminase isoform X2 [Nymphaea colorata]
MGSPSSTGGSGGGSALQLAMAAFLGASVTAVSAFLFHIHTLNGLIDYVQSLSRRKGLADVQEEEDGEEREAEEGDDDYEEDQDEEEEEVEEEVEEEDADDDRDEEKKEEDDHADDDEEAEEVNGNASVAASDSSLAKLKGDSMEEDVIMLRPSSNGDSSLGSLELNQNALPRLRTGRERTCHTIGHSPLRSGVSSTDKPSIPKSLSGIAPETALHNGKNETPLLENGYHPNCNCSSVLPEVSHASSPSGEPSNEQSISDISAETSRSKPQHDVLIRLKISPQVAIKAEDDEVCSMLQECLELREKYIFKETYFPWEKETVSDLHASNLASCCSSARENQHYFKMEVGVVHVYAANGQDLFPVANSTTFFTDMHQILKIASLGNARTTCFRRLELLEDKFNLHLKLNCDKEFLAQKDAPHRDIYNVRKVDTHVHHSACMNQKHLLRFIKSKLSKEPDEVVIFRDGKYLTLKEVFESLQLTGYDLNVDLLDVHVEMSSFHQFDKFNLKYNPFGQSRLREIFLKHDNLIQGRFLAQLTKEVLFDLEASKYQMAEYRISIHGRKKSEWDQLASWFVNNEIYSANAVWLIQLPRLYNVYKEMGVVTSFQNILDNVFIPLFEVTVDPSTHPQLDILLKQVVGFDLVDDESKLERCPTKHMPTPAEWTNYFNPAYSYYAYYCYANLYVLNKLRESKGMTIIKFRPHCGEAGDVDHLAAAFLVAHNIAHGNNLKRSPVLQYLYYLSQIGLAMSPLSNNSLFLKYNRNPFPKFFARGLNVSLSTDDPLQIHFTKEPLLEEYSFAAQVWKLSSCDLCEIARNSVYQSGFPHSSKSHWLGRRYYKMGTEGNDVHKTNVPQVRVEFRHEMWEEEMRYIYSGHARFTEEY